MTKSWLRKNNIPYIEKNISQDNYAQELANMGYRSTPVIIVKGETAIVGFNTRKLAAVLNI